jgi:hypothetical protein
MSFAANFIINGDGAYANEQIDFSDNSTIGAVIDSDSLHIEGNVDKADLVLSDYTITNITKYQWHFNDGNYYYDPTVSHKFLEPGFVQVKLTVWSESFIHSGQTFYFKYTFTKEVTVQGRFYKFLIDNFPTWEYIKNPQMDALFKVAGNFFDKLHTKISGIYNLVSIEKVDPTYFEVLAQTLGHDEYYRKVGYTLNQGDFSKYDIIDRITANTASSDEINSFRQFLSRSSDVFKKKGTPQDIIKFLEFFSLDGEPIDLWTVNFGKTSKGITEETFSEKTFDENKLALAWDNVKIIGNVNDRGHLIKNEGSITIDSYYKVQKYEQDAGAFTLANVINRKHPSWDIYELSRYVKQVRYGSDTYYTPVEMWMTPNEISDLLATLYVTTPWQSLDLEAEQHRIVFDELKTVVTNTSTSACNSSHKDTISEIKYIHSFLIRDIRLNNGTEISNFTENNDINPYTVDWRSALPSGGGLIVNVSAMPLNDYFQYYPYIQVKNFIELNHLLDQGQRMSISYLVANEKAIESSVVAKDDAIKDFDASATFSFEEPEKLTYNMRLPDNQIHVIFRGIKNDPKEKLAINQYYKATICAKENTFSISKVLTNTDGSIIQQKINLTGNRDNIVFDSLIKELQSEELFTFDYNQLYELKITVTGSLISAWIRRLSIETQMVSDIKTGLGNNNFGKDIVSDPWILLVENLDMNVGQENVTSYNIKNQVINNMEYVYFGDAGSIGFGCKNTIINVSKLIINNRDLDTTLYIPVEKQIYLKPKYLEWQRQRDIIFSSYDNTIPYFDATIVNKFNPQTSQYQLSSEKASSTQAIYFNNISVSDKLATRYTVWFDKLWLNNNYSIDGNLDRKFYDNIIIPFGSQKSPFISENTVYNKDIYKDNLGGTTSGSVGLFIANNSPILDDYEVKPGDAFSSTTRDGSGYGKTLYTNERIAQYKLSSRIPGFIGVYEEIFPLSNFFPELNGRLVLNDQSVFKNNFFNPVIVDTECGKRTIGVRFRNCKDILTTIKRYSTELQNEIYIYGHFTFHVPRYAVQFAPDNNFETSELYSDYVKYDLCVPLGILNEHIKTYNLSKQYIKEYGGMIINLNGVYVRLSQDQVSYSNTNGAITLKTLNQYENSYNELQCRYWLSANLDFKSNIYRDAEPNLSTTEKGINFFFNEDVRNLLTSLEQTSTYDISSDYRWWLPESSNTQWSGAFRKREFDIITVDLTNDLTTNLNYFGYDQNPMVNCNEQRDRAALKVLFGNKVGGFTFNLTASLISNAQCITADKPFNALQIRLTDGDINDIIQANTTYYAKVTVRINNSGFDQEDVDILSENERMKLKILGTNKKEKFKKAPVVKCHTFYLPFAWYDEAHKPNGNTIQYADFIRGSYGRGEVPSITLVPFGLLTELLNKMDAVDRQNVLNEGIDFSVWNKYLLDNMSIDGVYEPIPSSVCKLYKDYGIFNKINLNIGSYVEINYNKSDQIAWDVIDQFRYFFDGTKENFFALPDQINTMQSWIENIRDVKLNNYVVDTSLYTISNDNVLTLSDDSSYQYLNGSDMVGKYMLNLYLDVFNTSQNNFTFEEYTQNFNTKNQISFIPYEAMSLTPYKVVERTPSENLVFNNNDVLYDIISVGGAQAMRVNTGNTLIDTDRGKVGSTNVIKDINLNLSVMPDVQKLFIIDETSPVFDMETSVYFDEALDYIGDYRGKRLEFVIKANNTYSYKTKTYNLSEYYFVGIGTYEFDVGLGIAKYDATTDTLKKSFLVGFGDYNTKNIKSNTWYKLRVIATKDYIRVIFNERAESERLVINYNISPKNSNISDINQGNYEELSYIVKGLNNLDITYLDKIGEKTGREFVSGNVNTDLAMSKRPSGYMSGIVVFNQYTYITDIMYRIQKPKLRNFASVNDCSDTSTFITSIKHYFGEFQTVNFVGKTLNNTLVVHVDDILYYSDSNMNPVKFLEKDVIETAIFQNLVIITSKLNGSTNVTIVPETFKDQYSVFVKDNNFNVDHIYRYLMFTNRTIDKVYTNEGQISIVLNS